MWTHKHLKDVVTYWPPKGTKDDFGFTEFGTPILLYAKVFHKNQVVRNSVGAEIAVRDVYHLSAEVEELGFLLLGRYTEEPTPPKEAKEIKVFEEASDLRQVAKVFKAYT